MVAMVRATASMSALVKFSVSGSPRRGVLGVLVVPVAGAGAASGVGAGCGAEAAAAAAGAGGTAGWASRPDAYSVAALASSV